MYPYYGGAVSDLRQDDIEGIRNLYAAKNTPKTSNPSFDPASGNYSSPLEVRLNFGTGSNSQNTRIYYTLDGSEPTPYSYEFIPGGSDYIFQRYSNTIKARHLDKVIHQATLFPQRIICSNQIQQLKIRR